MTNLFGKTLKKNNHDYSNASVGEIISYLKNDLFEVTEKCSDQMLLKILAIDTMFMPYHHKNMLV